MQNPPDVGFLLDVEVEYGYGGHSIFAPSGSAMWLYCSGSLIANLLEEDDGCYEAAEGTVAHEVAEEWLRSGVKPVHRLGEVVWLQERPGKPVYEVEIDEVMLDFVEEYVHWCQCLPGKHYVETRVYFTQLMPRQTFDEEGNALPEGDDREFVPQGGTADHCACIFETDDEPATLIISDFKYGKGIYVEVVGNTQGMLYALGFFYEWDWLYNFQRIIIRIGQPRMANFAEWEVSREELLAFAEIVRDRAAAAWQVDAPRRVSEKGCRWCKAKYDCAAYAVAVDALAYAELETLENEVDLETMSLMKARLREQYKLHTATTSRLTHEEMVAMLKFRKPMEAYFESLFNKLTEDAKDGVKIPGKKLAESRSYRQWKNPSLAADHLEFLGVPRDHIFKTEIASPAQLEEALRKVAKIDKKLIPGLLEGYIYQPPGKATLVDDNDPRPEFGDMDDGAWDE